MADLLVIPSFQLKETDILTVDKLNLMATPVVELSILTPVTDENFFRNGNFYSSFWTTPAGISCPVGVETSNANYWFVNPNGAAVTCLQSPTVPDLYSLYSMEVQGAVSVTDVAVGAQILGDLSATLRRPCTWSGYIYNNTAGLLSPTLEIWTCNAFNNFSAITFQTSVNLQSIPIGQWGYDTVTIDLSGSTLHNVANGLFIKVRIPSGSLAQTTYNVNFSRLKFQLGEVATGFVDDPALFQTTPSVSASMLQDGCIARPGLFLSEVIPSGAYQGGSILGEDIAANTVAASNLAAGAVTGNLGYTPVNKAGDTMTGNLTVNPSITVNNPSATPTVYLSSGPAATTNEDTVLLYKNPNGDQYARIGYQDPTGTSLWNGVVLDSHHGVDTNSYQAGSITLQALAQSLINILIPSGEIRGFGGPNIPSGWLICDGTAISRVTYATLYAAIGTYWGSGDNISTFNLPDLRGRSPVGYVNSPIAGITSRAFGSNGGEENHTLSANELAYHNHTLHDPTHIHPYSDPGHQHAYFQPGGTSIGVTGGTSQINYPSGTLFTGMANANFSISYAATNVTIDPVGANWAHNNMQPFAVIYWMIKT